MPETKGTINAIKQWDELCKSFVSLEMAELIKDGSLGGSVDYVKVYNIFVGSGLDLKKVCWRFHFDERPGAKCSLRVSDIGMDVMVRSMTVMSVLRKLNMKFTNGNKYDIEKLGKVMEEALVIIENRRKDVKNHAIIAEAKEASKA